MRQPLRDPFLRTLQLLLRGLQGHAGGVRRLGRCAPHPAADLRAGPRDEDRRGRRRGVGRRIPAALLRFYAVCSVGALSNVGTSSWLYAHYPVWWIAGLTGSVIAALWNFVGSSRLVWSRA